MFPTLQQLAELSAISFSIEPRHIPIHLQCSSTLDTLSKYELHFANPIKIYVGQESTISPVAYGIGYVIRIKKDISIVFYGDLHSCQGGGTAFSVFIFFPTKSGDLNFSRLLEEHLSLPYNNTLYGTIVSSVRVHCAVFHLSHSSVQVHRKVYINDNLEMISEELLSILYGDEE